MNLAHFFRIRLFSIFLILVLGSFSVSVYAQNTGAYTQLSSLQNQLATGSSNLALLETVNSMQNLSSTQNKITVKSSGLYFVMAAGQVGAIKEGVNGYVDLWLIQNGKAVANSNTRLTVDNKSTSVLVSQTLIQLKAGDTISVGYSASDSSMGLIATPETNSEPAIPSIIFSMYKI